MKVAGGVARALEPQRSRAFSLVYEVALGQVYLRYGNSSGGGSKKSCKEWETMEAKGDSWAKCGADLAPLPWPPSPAFLDHPFHPPRHPSCHVTHLSRLPNKQQTQASYQTTNKDQPSVLPFAKSEYWSLGTSPKLNLHHLWKPGLIPPPIFLRQSIPYFHVAMTHACR